MTVLSNNCTASLNIPFKTPFCWCWIYDFNNLIKEIKTINMNNIKLSYDNHTVVRLDEKYDIHFIHHKKGEFLLNNKNIFFGDNVLEIVEEKWKHRCEQFNQNDDFIFIYDELIPKHYESIEFLSTKLPENCIKIFITHENYEDLKDYDKDNIIIHCKQEEHTTDNNGKLLIEKFPIIFNKNNLDKTKE